MHVAVRMLQMFKKIPPSPRQSEINGAIVNTCHTAQIKGFQKSLVCKDQWLFLLLHVLAETDYDAMEVEG